ncbi:MAG: hypothetical protein RL596_1755 [Bacteroidota bacterium]
MRIPVYCRKALISLPSKGDVIAINFSCAQTLETTEIQSPKDVVVPDRAQDSKLPEADTPKTE